MPFSVNLIRKLETVDTDLREVLISILDEVERNREESVTKKEFHELHGIVRDLGHSVQDLAEAQKRTEIKVEELVEVQKRTEIKVEELVEVQKRTEIKVKELAEAQKRTEIKVEELAEAQKRTEIKVEELAEAQKRTEQRFEELTLVQKELAQAQKETQGEVKLLAQELRYTRSDLGGLTLSISYGFENEAYRMLPEVLNKHYGIAMTDRLVRAEIGGKEINVFGHGRQNGNEVVIVGEAKLRLDERREKKHSQNTFTELEEKVAAVRSEEGECDIVRVLLTHYATKGFLRRAKERGIIVVQSFDW